MSFCTINELISDKMTYDILKRKICYTTLQASDDLLRCTRCKCAWYLDAEQQRAHWPIHKITCKRPDFQMVSSLSGEKCYELVCTTFPSSPDHNTAAALVRLYSLIRQEDGKPVEDQKVFSEDLDDMACHLQAITRLNSSVLDRYYEKVWACPGMAQFLLFTDLRTIGYKKTMKKFPEGLPVDQSDEECEDFDDHLYDDSSGEHLAWFVIGFLIRSCVSGTLSMCSNHDGRGMLRDTAYAKAARLRLTEIFSNPVLHKSSKKALYPIPGYVLNIAENLPTEFIKMLNKGIFFGIIRWADIDYSVQTLKIIANMGAREVRSLTKATKLNILESCCYVFQWPGCPIWSSIDEDQDAVIYDQCMNIAGTLMLNSRNVPSLLEDGMNRRLEQTPDWSSTDFAIRRIVLAYLHAEIGKNKGRVTLALIKNCLTNWKEIKIFEQMEYAQKVMDPEPFEKWRVGAERVRKLWKEFEKKDNKQS